MTAWGDVSMIPAVELAALHEDADRVWALRARVADLEARQYHYLGKDGKTVLARDLEDQRDALREEVTRLRAENAQYATENEQLRTLVANLEDLQARDEATIARLEAESAALRSRLSPVEALAREIAPLHAKATAGPWWVDADPREGMDWNNHIMSGKVDRVAFMSNLGDGKTDEVVATAHLIATLRNGAAVIIAAGGEP